MIDVLIWVFRLILPVTFLALAVGAGGRYAIRHLNRDRRERVIGSLVWHELVYEGRTAHQDGDNHKVGQENFRGLVSLSQQLRQGARWPYRSRGVASFVWLRTSDGLLRLYLGIDAGHSGDGPKVLASSLSCRLDPCDAPDIPTASSAIAWRKGSVPYGVRDFVETPGALAGSLSKVLESLPAGESGAFVMTLDIMRAAEAARTQANIIEDVIMKGGEGAIHNSVAKEAGIMTTHAMRMSCGASLSTPDIGSGGSDAASVLRSSLASVSNLGWDVEVFSPAKVGTRASSLFALGGAGTAGILLVVGALPVPIGLAMVALCVGAGALVAVQHERLVQSGFISRLRSGEIVVPSFFWWSLRWRVHGLIRSDRYDAGGDTKVGNRVAWPSDKQVISVHPASLYEMVSFPGAASVDVAKNAVRSLGIPATMVDVPWPMFLGTSGSGQHICADLGDLHFGEYVAGTPGSGKTNYLQVVFAGTVRACLEQSAGMLITPIWAETKGEGAYEAWEIARHHPGAIFVDAHNPNSARRFALEGRRLSEGATVKEVVTSCSTLVEGLQFAWGDGIRSASKELLDQAFRIAMLLTEEEIEDLQVSSRGIRTDKPNIISLASLILGSDDRIDVGPRLLHLQEDSEDDADLTERQVVLYDAISTLSRFLTEKREKAAVAAIAPALNKLSDLSNARAIWEPSNTREDFYIQDVPSAFVPIVLNLGFYIQDGIESQTETSDAINQRHMRIATYLLWNTVKTTCTGWQRQAKRVTFFSDEVSDVAVDSQNDDVPNVVAAAAKSGRSKGFSMKLGSQSPGQIPEDTRYEVLSSRTKFWFSFHDAPGLKYAVEDLSSGDAKNLIFSPSDIRNLPDGTCVGIMKRGSAITTPFTLRVVKAHEWSEFLFARDEYGDLIPVEDAIVDYYRWAKQNREKYAQGGNEPVRAGA